jgi:hypothetical protein
MGQKKDSFEYQAKNLNISDIGPENGGSKQTLGGQPWWFKLQIVGILLGALVIIIGFAGLLAVPFEPYKFYGWENVPAEVCPQEQLMTSTITEVEDGPYTLDKAVGYVSIVNSNERAVDTWAVDAEVQPHPKQVEPSGVIRTAPIERGYYKLGLDITVDGYALGIVPRYQEIEIYSDKSFFVLSESASQCRDS